MLQSSDHAILLSEAERLRPKSVATLLDQNSDRVSQLTCHRRRLDAGCIKATD